MTVAELIAKLSLLPQDFTVISFGPSGDDGEFEIEPKEIDGKVYL